jgi:hypothetical protein
MKDDQVSRRRFVETATLAVGASKQDAHRAAADLAAPVSPCGPECVMPSAALAPTAESRIDCYMLVNADRACEVRHC